jgi:ADP-ribosyl-[dinitrogen reductase] hydrolase
MQAGENTLDTLIARLLIKNLIKEKSLNVKSF